MTLLRYEISHQPVYIRIFIFFQKKKFLIFK